MPVTLEIKVARTVKRHPDPSQIVSNLQRLARLPVGMVFNLDSSQPFIVDRTVRRSRAWSCGAQIRFTADDLTDSQVEKEVAIIKDCVRKNCVDSRWRRRPWRIVGEPQVSHSCDLTSQDALPGEANVRSDAAPVGSSQISVLVDCFLRSFAKEFPSSLDSQGMLRLGELAAGLEKQAQQTGRKQLVEEVYQKEDKSARLRHLFRERIEDDPFLDANATIEGQQTPEPKAQPKSPNPKEKPLACPALKRLWEDKDGALESWDGSEFGRSNGYDGDRKVGPRIEGKPRGKKRTRAVAKISAPPMRPKWLLHRPRSVNPMSPPF